MTLRRFLPISLLCVVLCLFSAPASAQNILVTTGEHASFTRLVLQSARPIAWQLHPRSEGNEIRTLSIAESEADIDISRAFHRIPRSRLANLIRTQAGLELHLNCDCPINAWTEREGLVVLDIGTPQPMATAPDSPTGPTTGIILPLRFTQSDLARSAGVALARTWSADADNPGIADTSVGQGPIPSPIAETERQAIMQQLTAQVAGALTQGILDPSHENPAHLEMIRLSNGDASTAIPPNLRIMSVLDRPDDEPSLLPDDQPNACAAAAALDFVVTSAPGNFNIALAAGLSRWFGEFDQPEQAATEELVTLYLQHGFGAEARALIENAVNPIPGRDLLLGFADTLEGRQSNSRLRLAEQHGCGGAAAMLAALAGAPSPRIRARAGDIASTFAQAPGVLRTGLGGALIRILVESDALDAGRVVADTLRRTPHARSADLQMADAMLDRARGEAVQAGARLTHDAGDDVDSVLLRLQIALETGAFVPESVLLNAEAIASTHRSTTQGKDLLAAVIRLRIAAGTAIDALALVDRLRGWERESTQGRARIEDLGDMLWFGLALQASDPGLLELLLNRTDWRDPSFSVETRTALAERLLGFGLTEAAEALLSAPRAEADRHLLARLHLDREEPDLALAVLGDDQSDSAESLRAHALHARGESQASSRLFAGLGAFDAAARTAVLGRDWAMLQEVWAEDGNLNQRGLARALAGLTPDADREVAPADEVETADPIPTTDTDPASPVAEQILPAEMEAAASAPPGGLASEQEPASEAGAPTPQTPAPRATLATSDPAPVLNPMARGATLLAESEELRAAFAPLLIGFGETEN